jgi:hypothetical protein
MFNGKLQWYKMMGGGSIGGGSNGVQSKPKEKTDMRYARIYELVADGSMPSAENYKNKEPIGRAYYNSVDQHWIKFNNEWHGPGQYGYKEINKAEFDTDQAFELFPILKVAYRPVRMWFKLHQRLMHLVMLVSSFLTLNVAMNVPNFVSSENTLFFIVPLALMCTCSVIWQLGKWEKWNWWTNWFDIPVTFE